LPESLEVEPLSIADALAYARAHPVADADPERFIAIFASGAQSLVDLRAHGLLGVVMDRLRIADDAKPFEWVGAGVPEIDAATFPVALERIRSVARGLGIGAVDITLHGLWSSQRDRLAAAGARPQFLDLEMTHADCAWGPNRALPQGWHWEMASPERERAYFALLDRSMGPMPGVYVPPEPEAIASMRTTADGTKLLLDQDGKAQALIRCKLEKRYLHLVAAAPESKGRGLGRLALDEVRRMLGPGPLHLTVVKQNAHAHGFYLHMGFVETEEVETWRLKIGRIKTG
jgi:GNAT superfamily N-acetyltransferase